MLRILDALQVPERQVFDLLSAIYNSTDYMAQSFEEKYPSIESFRNELQEHRDHKGSLFLVAEQEGTLVGYIRIEPVASRRLSHTAHLSLGSLPQAQGQGIGRRLLEEALKQVSKSGTIEIIYLHVRADNKPAVHLYETVGFEILTTLEKDTRLPQGYRDVYLMRKFVTSAGK